jgi:hypothetical protein
LCWLFIPSTPHHVLPFSLFVFKYFVLGGDVLMAGVFPSILY